MMSTFKIFNFSAVNTLNYSNLLFLRNTVKVCIDQRASLSRKTLVKLGVPLPPKKPLTPYIKFLQTNRPILLQNQPDLSPTEAIKALAQKWTQCDPEEKQLLQKNFIKEMEIYLTEIEQYKASITQEQSNLIEKTKLKQKRNQMRSRLQEKEEALGKPKKPSSAFLNFLAENKDVKIDNMKYNQWVKELGKKWETFPDKEKYIQKVKCDWEQYKSELLNWEEKMIRQGHLDVVRSKELLVKNPKVKSRKRAE